MSLRSQVSFNPLSDCTTFKRNVFKRDDSFCMECMKHLRNHQSSAVSDADLERFLKEEAGRGGNLILQHPKGEGKLFLGGSGASGPKFVHAENISHVVNTATGIESFDPVWARNVKKLIEEEGLVVKRLEWSDDREQKIWKETPYDQLVESVEFIDTALREGKNVAVHCAQGVSRSSTVIISYLMATMGFDFDEALAFTQDKRPAALPNTGFTKQLKEFQKSESLTNLREKYRFN